MLSKNSIHYSIILIRRWGHSILSLDHKVQNFHRVAVSNTSCALTIQEYLKLQLTIIEAAHKAESLSQPTHLWDPSKTAIVREKERWLTTWTPCLSACVRYTSRLPKITDVSGAIAEIQKNFGFLLLWSHQIKNTHVVRSQQNHKKHEILNHLKPCWAGSVKKCLRKMCNRAIIQWWVHLNWRVN